MKKLLLISSLLIAGQLVNAGQLSPDEALMRVSETQIPAAGAVKMSRAGAATPLMVIKSPEAKNFTSLYVFGLEKEGYIVVSADDCAVPLLGYSDTGNFDAENLSPTMRWWLDFYASEISYAANHGAAARRSVSRGASRADRSPIAPLLTTKWDQDAPYNNDCPMDGSARSVTGCVATAMAQAMKFHNYPPVGTGSVSYKWGTKTLSMDFSQVNFDWQNMTDTYNSSSTSQQQAAVAELMYACGLSVEMDYSSSESGASSLELAPALYNYFGYSDAMVMPERPFYTLNDWESMIYDQLQNNMPVLYGGVSNQGGHQFVCDGYSADGYFHFNWGWSGMSDGYYLLSALDPETQGIGGSTSGYNYEQGILINMAPKTASLTASPLIYCYGDFEISRSTVNLGSTATFKSSDAFYNFGCKQETGNMGIKLVNQSGAVQYVASAQTSRFPTASGFQSFSVTLPTSLSAGTYTVTPCFRQSGSDTWSDMLAPLSGIRALKMTVSGSSATFADIDDINLQFSNFSIDTALYLDTYFKSTFTVTNNGENEYYGQLMFGLADSSYNIYGESAAPVAIDLAPGESTTVEYISYFPSTLDYTTGTETVSPGTYNLVVYDYVTGWIEYEYPSQINLLAAPSSASVAVSDFTIVGGTTVTTPDAVKFTGTLVCQNGYFADQVTVAIFPEGASETSIIGASNYLFVTTNNSAPFTAVVSIPDAVEGNNYFAIAYYGSKEISQELSFTIGEIAGVNDATATSDIDFVVTADFVRVEAPSMLDVVRVYGIDGRMINQYRPAADTSIDIDLNGLETGSYILTATDKAGNSRALHFARR